MSWIAVAGTVVSVGVGAYNASQSAKAQEKAAASGAAGSRVVPPEFTPVNLDQSQVDSVRGNLGAMPYIKGLTDMGNKFITAEALQRANKLIPGYRSAMKTYAQNTGSLLHGELPFSDVLDITGDANSLGTSLGTPGTSGNATLKDLGLSRLSAMEQGGNMLGNMVNIASQISPTSNYLTPQNMFLSPSERAQFDVQQNEDQYSAALNQATAAASPDPSALLRMQAGQNTNNAIASGVASGAGNIGSLLANHYAQTGAAGRATGVNYPAPGTPVSSWRANASGNSYA